MEGEHKGIWQVKWTDIANHHGWAGSDRDLSLVTVQTIGYLIYLTPMTIGIAQSLTEDGESSEVMVIPRSVIVAVEQLKWTPSAATELPDA